MWCMCVCCRSFLLNAGAGMFYEAAAEMAFPMDEIVPGCVLSIFFCFCGGCYMLVASAIPSRYMNWILTSACLAGVAALSRFREVRRREAVDVAGVLVDSPLLEPCVGDAKGADAVVVCGARVDVDGDGDGDGMSWRQRCGDDGVDALTPLLPADHGRHRT